MNAEGLSREHLGFRVQITRQYGYGPHSVLGELQRIDHGPETTWLDLNVLGENFRVEVKADDQLEVLAAEG